MPENADPAEPGPEAIEAPLMARLAALEIDVTMHRHPLHNEATIAVAPADLMRFVGACDHPPLLFGLDELAEIAARRRAEAGDPSAGGS